MKDLNVRKLLLHMISILVARAAFLSMNPFAVGYFAILYQEGAGGITLLLFSAVGVISKMGIIDGAPYLMILFFAYIILEMLDRKRPAIYQWLCLGVPVVLTGFIRIFVFQSEKGEGLFVTLRLLEIVILVIFALLVKRAIRVLLHLSKGYRPNSEQVVSISVLLAVVLYALPKINFNYISPIHTVMFFLIIFTTYKYGVGQGAVTGAVCGIITCISGGSVADVGLYCMLGIAPALFRELGRITMSTIFVITAVGLWLLQYSEIFGRTEFGALISAILMFLLLPVSIVYRLDQGVVNERQSTPALQNVRSIARERMLNFSDSFLKLASAYSSLSGKSAVMEKQEVNHVFEDLSERLCKNCSNCEACWEKDFMQTYQAACDVFEVAEKKGFIEEQEIPSSFQSICICADEFCREANRGFELVKLNQNWCNRMQESREAISSQFIEVSKVIKELAGDLYNTIDIPVGKEDKLISALKANHILVRNVTLIEKSNKRQEVYVKAACRRGRCVTTKEIAGVISDVLSMRVVPSATSKTIISKDYDTYIFLEDTKYKVLTGLARAKKEKNPVSGDNYTIQSLDTGESLIALADGMGTGTKACEESEEVIALLEQLIQAGFRRDVAIKLVNTSMVLKAGEQSFSTIDMSVINLFTGMCEFIKIGAAAAFIKRDNWVETITSTTLPIGMFHSVDYDTISKKLYDGDLVVMVTDGVLDAFPVLDKEEYMQKLILDIKSKNPQEIANCILEEACKEQKEGKKDDMTVITVGIWEKFL